jgi:hypothetical protein
VNQLQSILAQDPAVTGTVNVQFEDIYKTITHNVRYDGSTTNEMVNRCHSLAQHYMWPEGKHERLANLRGEGSHQWDYIILCFDPYILGNFPGMVAEGVKLIQQEVAKSAHPAQILLFAQWPWENSIFSADDYNEVVQRVGASAGLPVVPAGKVWESYTPKDSVSGDTRPTPKGAYLGAASIYAKIFDRSAKTSAYTFAPDGDNIADHALAEVRANASISHYSGKYDGINPFQMKYVTKRVVSDRHTGTSTERRIRDGLVRLANVQRIQFTTSSYSSPSGLRWDFNYGRGNDRFEASKQYNVDPNRYDRAYGFPMHHYYMNSAPNTMPYGIDKQYSTLFGYDDGTDLGIAFNMIRPGTRKLSLPEDVRAIPIRLMWLKMAQISPGFHPLNDNTHMSDPLNDASAAYIYTLLSGRCPVVPEPENQDSVEWLQWLGHKIGYETAWQMAHLTTRVPGFRVLPSAASKTTVSPTNTETMTVQVAYPPQEDVTVSVGIDTATAAIVWPRELTFDASNYNVPQQITIIGLPGSPASQPFNVVFATSSDDEIHDLLSDEWRYTNNRSSTTSVSQVDAGTAALTTPQFTALDIDLNAAGATSGNTILLGPANGTVTWSGTADIQYTPAGDYHGPDQIVYAVTHNGTQTLGVIDITVAVQDGQVNVIASDPFAVAEGPETGSYLISRVGDPTEPLLVYFSMSGTATLGDDYTLSHTSPVTIPAGEESITIILAPIDGDETGGANKTAILTILEDAAYPIGVGSAVITIDSDSTPPTVNAGPDQTIFLTGEPWSPLELAPGLWLDAADISSLTLNGSAASQWSDKSGNNRHATQGNSANQPLQTPAGLNGMSVITFDGSNDFFSVDLDFLAGTSHTAFIVTRATGFSNIYGAANSSQGSSSLHVGFNGNNYRMNFWSNDFAPSRSANFVAGSANIVNYVWNQGVGKQIFANGKSEGSNTNAGTIGTMSGGGRIGHTTTGTHTGFGGDIAEIIIIPSTIAVADREKIEGYLAHKWGLAGNLAADHPYKAESPSGATAVATLAGSATNPGNDPLTTTWSVQNGPASVMIENPASTGTTATFTQPGTYTLRLTASDELNIAFDDVTITVISAGTPAGGYATWSGGDPADSDSNLDGVPNAIAWALGAPGPGANATNLLPTADTSDPDHFVFTFQRSDEAHADANTTITVEYGSDLSGWTTASDGVDGVNIDDSAIPEPGLRTVVVTIPKTLASGDKLFARLNMVVNTP